MSYLPEQDPRTPLIMSGDNANLPGNTPVVDATDQSANAPKLFPEPIAPSTALAANLASPVAEPLLFHSYMEPPVRRPVRIPHFGHLMLLSLLISIALGILGVALALASHYHLFGWHLSAKAATDITFNLVSEIVIYLVTFGFSLLVFPMIWNEGYFAGVQWRGNVVRARFRLLEVTAAVCLSLAILDEVLMPGPKNAPIEKMISSPGAAWAMFAFGITMAPFFEEMFFRGFLLPALATACDWAAESIKGTLPRPLDLSGHPQWSMPAMTVASIATSILFALVHVAQQGHSLGPFLLLIVISLILCAVRLKTKSLAASTMVHASYNFFIFFIELVATGGFRHFDKM